MQSNETFVADPGRINVLSLLNPEPEHPFIAQNSNNNNVVSSSEQTRGVSSSHGYSSDKLQGTQKTSTILNETDGYEMAPWRQESGLGPPTSQPTHMAGTQQQPSHQPRQIYYSSSSRYYSGFSQVSKSRAANGEFHKQMHGSRDTAKDVYPHIFVPEQPIFGHSAVSKDKTRDYIRPCPSDEPLGSAPHALLPTTVRLSTGAGEGFGCRSNSSVMSVEVLLGKRMRIGDFSDDDDDDDDEGNSGAAVSVRATEEEVVKKRGSQTSSSSSSSSSSSGSEAATSIPSSPTVVRSEEPRRSKLRRTTEARKTSPALEMQQSPDAEDKPEVDWQSLGVPADIWAEAQELYDKVKAMKKVQNRQPRRMKPAILAALMFILCRSHGYPRTFAELCAAANVTKREIGMYYKLMNQVLDAQYTMTERAKPSAFLQRWCTALDLPLWIPEAACRVYERADEMGIVQGKSPVSISAASIWLVIWCFNHRVGLQHRGFVLPTDTPVSSVALPNVPGLGAAGDPIRCDQRDVCKAASVVIATLASVFKLLLPHLSTLVQGIFPSCDVVAP